MLVIGYWVPVGACSFTMQATQTTREGGDDKIYRGRGNRIIVAAVSDRAIIMGVNH